MPALHGVCLLQLLLPFAVLLPLVVSEKPAWKHEMCFWNTPSEECLSYIGFYPGSYLSPKVKCGKTSISSAATCGAQKDSAGKDCFWASADEICHERVCKSYNETVCAANKASPSNCMWSGYECFKSDTSCKNTGSYSTDAACTADASEVGPCLWKAMYTPKCQQLACTDFKNATSCSAGSSKVPAMTFMLGSAPYGKTPCHWSGSCQQIYQCANYMSQTECKADSAGFGKCAWNANGGKCTDMLYCDAYTSQSLCVADSYKTSVKKHPKAKCWWEKGPAAFAVGPALALEGIWKAQGPIKTSGNIEINADLTMKVIDGKGGYLGLALGIGLAGALQREVMQVTNKAGAVQAWADIPKPVPDGYTIQINGACADDLPSLSEYLAVKEECDKKRLTEALCKDSAISSSASATSSSAGSTTSGSGTTSSSGSATTSSSATTAGAAAASSAYMANAKAASMLLLFLAAA